MKSEHMDIEFVKPETAEIFELAFDLMTTGSFGKEAAEHLLQTLYDATLADVSKSTN